MDLAFNGIICPKQWEHDPNLQENINGSTVAMHLADKCVIPPKHWEHDPQL